MKTTELPNPAPALPRSAGVGVGAIRSNPLISSDTDDGDGIIAGTATPGDIQRMQSVFAGLPEDILIDKDLNEINHKYRKIYERYPDGSVKLAAGIRNVFTPSDLHAIANHMARENSLKSRFQSGKITHREAIKELANTFPTLAECPQWFGPDASWDIDFVERLAKNFRHCDGGIHACRFVLMVWNPELKPKFGRFDLNRAFSNWDITHRTAFINWALDPWWP